MKKEKLFNKGFTLLELLVVVLIIGILAAIALPQYKLAVAKSRLANILPVFASIKQAQEVYYMLHNKYTDYAEDLDIDLSYCDKSSDYDNVLICDKYFMIDVLDAAEKGILRAAYCPNEIKDTKRWDQCAYHKGDYVYTLSYSNSRTFRDPFCNYTNDLGQKVCESFGFPVD